VKLVRQINLAFRPATSFLTLQPVFSDYASEYFPIYRKNRANGASVFFSKWAYFGRSGRGHLPMNDAGFECVMARNFLGLNRALRLIVS
jgi:hypothetical protein